MEIKVKRPFIIWVTQILCAASVILSVLYLVTGLLRVIDDKVPHFLYMPPITSTILFTLVPGIAFLALSVRKSFSIFLGWISVFIMWVFLIRVFIGQLSPWEGLVVLSHYPQRLLALIFLLCGIFSLTALLICLSISKKAAQFLTLAKQDMTESLPPPPPTFND